MRPCISKMAKKKIIFESVESVYGRHLRSKEWVEYKTVIKIRDSGKQPISIDLEFVGIQPFAFEMPPHKSIRAESITRAFVKLAKFLKGYGIEMK